MLVTICSVLIVLLILQKYRRKRVQSGRLSEDVWLNSKHKYMYMRESILGTPIIWQYYSLPSCPPLHFHRLHRIDVRFQNRWRRSDALMEMVSVLGMGSSTFAQYDFQTYHIKHIKQTYTTYIYNRHIQQTYKYKTKMYKQEYLPNIHIKQICKQGAK